MTQGCFWVLKIVIFEGSGFLGLHESNSSHLKMDGWKMKIPFGMAYFQGRTVSFRECNQVYHGFTNRPTVNPHPCYLESWL